MTVCYRNVALVFKFYDKKLILYKMISIYFHLYVRPALTLIPL